MRLVLADDHILFRELLAAELTRCNDVQDVQQARHAEDAVSLYGRHRPDVVILGTNLRDRSAFDAAQTIRTIDADARLLFLCERPCDAEVEAALALEPRGIIVKHDGIETLAHALRTIVDGGSYFSDPIRSRLICENGRLRLTRSCSDAVRRLTERERELLIHLSRGASVKEAAAAMNVTYKTADNQKSSIMRKLDIHDRVELARFAIREGVIGPA